MAERLGVAVVGLGVGEAHARAYAADPRCELRLVHDLDAHRAHTLAAELGAAAAASWEELLADDSVVIVSIASFDDDHFEHARAALERGKHVFVEKPLCRTLDEVRTLRALLAARPRLRLASNLVLRAAPLYGWLREERAAGRLGTVYAFDGDYVFGRLHKITTGWRGSVSDYSVIQGGGIHLVDLMLWICGERPLRVHAVGNRISTENSAFRYLDYVAATYEFPSGLVGRISANFGSVQPHQHVVRVFGTAASFVYDDVGSRVFRSRDPAVRPEAPDLAALPLSKGALVPRFVDAVAAADASPTAADHEFAVISACVAADRSLVEGKPVDVDYA